LDVDYFLLREFNNQQTANIHSFLAQQLPKTETSSQRSGLNRIFFPLEFYSSNNAGAAG
jgi:hypothetical protein